MDSESIFAASEHMKHKVKWFFNKESEWIYCGLGSEINKEYLDKTINDFFKDEKIFIAYKRHESFEINKIELLKAIDNLLVSLDFILWDSKFNYAIEFNNIGVFRKGKCFE